MSDLSSLAVPAQPLRRIVQPTPVARQRKMTIGRIALNSQFMANSFARATSIRRSVSSDSSVRFPTWLLPALPSRADDLDPYRDRDIIALRQARMKNRVVRQIQPRGLPMAAHAHGRSRAGVQTGPSSIARRLHPIRRQPSKNDAHIGPSTMPLVRVAAQPQRPTARPPRTRSSNTPARNGNRTDRDGPRPRAVDSLRKDQFDLPVSESFSAKAPTKQSSLSPQSSPRFDSVMVARSLLMRPETSATGRPNASTPDSAESSHRLTLPRASGRTSVDRSAIHRRSLSTRQPLVSPSSRIPLSMMYEPPRRFSAPQSAATNTPIMRSRSTTGSKTPTDPLITGSSTTGSSTTTRQIPELPTSTTSGPNWTSFPARDSVATEVSRKADTTTSVKTLAKSAPSPSPTSFSSPEVITDSTSASPSSATIQQRGFSAPNNNAINSDREAGLRRRPISNVNIPQAAGWRQVMGLSHESEQPTTPQTGSHHQDSLFRRVAALANPTNAPLGSPGDIARRSPVSGSLISIASSMRSAVLNQRESTVPMTSRQMDRSRVSRQTRRRPVSASRSEPNSTTISNATRPIAPISRSERTVVPSELTRRATQRQVTNSPSVNAQNFSTSSPTMISRSSLRNQKPSASATSRVQKPSFVDMWSSVNQSVSRQSHLIARRSLRLPQVHVHSLSSKPGTIVRQQFGLNDRSTEAFDQSSHSTVRELRRRKSQRASHALRSASQGNPSSARVLLIARESHSHMSSVTPGASSGTHFAGSLAQAISRRQTQGDTTQNETTNTPRDSVGAVSRSTTNTAIQRRAVPNGSSSNRVMTSDPIPLTGAGSGVAQNFLDRLSKKTGEDFAPAITPHQGIPVSTSADIDVIARSVSRRPRVENTIQYSDPSDRSVDSSVSDLQDDQPHWAAMRTPSENVDLGTSDLISRTPSSADTSARASRAMGDTASVTNASIMRSVVANPAATRSENQLNQTVQATGHRQRSVSAPSSAQSSTSQSLTTGSRSRMTKTGAKQSRQEIVERGGSIASRGALHRAVSRSVPTQRLSSPLNDLPVSPNVTPGMRIPSEAMSALPTVPNVARVASDPSRSTSASSSAPSADISRSTINNRVVSRSPSSPSSSNVRRDGRRSVSINRQASGVQFGPSEDGTISADALVRMIESGQSIPNQVVHRQVSGTTSSGIMRRPSSSDQVSRSVSSTTIRRSSSAVEKAAPGPVSILSQVLAPSDDSDSGTSQITTSQLLDLMDWINRTVDDRLRQELERRGVAGGRW